MCVVPSCRPLLGSLWHEILTTTKNGFSLIIPSASLYNFTTGGGGGGGGKGGGGKGTILFFAPPREIREEEEATDRVVGTHRLVFLFTAN